MAIFAKKDKEKRGTGPDPSSTGGAGGSTHWARSGVRRLSFNSHRSYRYGDGPGPGPGQVPPSTSVEALAVSTGSPMPGNHAAAAAGLPELHPLDIASSRNLPSSASSSNPRSRTASPARQSPNPDSRPHPRAAGPHNAFVSSPASTTANPNHLRPSVEQQRPRHPLHQSAGPPSSNLTPPRPFQGSASSPASQQRANSDSAVLADGSPRQRPVYGAHSQNGGSTPTLMMDPRKAMVTKARPSSFLGFLSGGNSSRSSVVTATAGLTMNGGKKSGGKASKGGKPVVTEAISVSSGPSRKGPSRVVAVVGNVRLGIGRMIVEELVRNRTIVVALTDCHDGQFGKDLEALALSPSLFHAFPVPALFGTAFVPQQAAAAAAGADYIPGSSASTPNLSMSTGSTPSLSPLGIPTPPPLGSTASFPSMGKRGKFSKNSSRRTSQDQSMSAAASGLTTSTKLSAATKAFNERHACLIELSNIFKSYRVDTVIAIFEPRDRNVTSKSSGGGSKTPNGTAKATDDAAAAATVPPLPPAQEKARIEEMERVVLQAAIECGAGRFATCAWTPSLFPSPLSVGPTPPPDFAKRAPLSVTVFRWGLLMNELAAGVPPNEHGESALGRWLEPPSRRSGRFVVDYGKSTCYLPDVAGKGKGVGGVSLTLAEDVARFVGLACKMKAEWEWSTGTMVGERIRGGWEEVVDMLDTICRYNFRREYVSAPLVDSSPNSSMDHLNAPSDPHMRRADSGHSSTSSSGDDDSAEARPVQRHRERSPVDIDDVLRGILAKENLDASSVRLGEFLRVWFSPRPRSGGLTPPVHGPRAIRPSGSFDNSRPGHGLPRAMTAPEQNGRRGPPPARSSGAAGQGRTGPPPGRGDGGRGGPNGMVNGHGHGHHGGSGGGGGGGGGGMLTMAGGRHHPAAMAPAVRSPLAQSA